MDSIKQSTIYQGEKVYRLKLKIAGIKHGLKPTPNYWDENEMEEVAKCPANNSL